MIEPLVQTTNQNILTETEAISLIEGANLNPNTPQKWADLGCGSGLFSYALSSLLPKGSHILAIDKDRQNVPQSFEKRVSMEFLQADFTKNSIPINEFDGVLMANSLHYVKEQGSFIRNLKSRLTENGQFIIIEYDTVRRNPWVPYPVSYTKLNDLFAAEGYSRIRKIGERASRYGYNKMYACHIRP